MQLNCFLHAENHFLKCIIKYERERQGVIFSSIIWLKIPEIIPTEELTWEDELVIVQSGSGGNAESICKEQHQRKVAEHFRIDNMKEQLRPN